MCGRTVVSGDSKTIARRCSYSNRNAESVQPKWRSISTNQREERESSDNDASENQQVRKTSEHFFEPSFNIGPQSKLPVLVSSQNLLTDEREDEKSSDDERCLTAMRWGLQREFMKDSGTKYSTFNCRAESKFNPNKFTKFSEKGNGRLRRSNKYDEGQFCSVNAKIVQKTPPALIYTNWSARPGSNPSKKRLLVFWVVCLRLQSFSKCDHSMVWTNLKVFIMAELKKFACKVRDCSVGNMGEICQVDHILPFQIFNK